MISSCNFPWGREQSVLLSMNFKWKYSNLWNTSIFVKVHLTLSLIVNERMTNYAEWTRMFYAVKFRITDTSESFPLVLLPQLELQQRMWLWTETWHWWFLRCVCLPTNNVQRPLTEHEQSYSHSFMGLFSYPPRSTSLTSLFLVLTAWL